MPQEFIRVRGARQHNLKNIDVDIPRHQLVVLTGVSGSGKSSLAFDTLYAEGQRRYVQSLSAYARQFLGQIEKPDVDFIEGLSPAVAIEQMHSSPNPRSTIATVTEIYDYLRVLYAVAGQPHDPTTGEKLVKSTPAQIGDKLLALGEGVRCVVLAPLGSQDGAALKATFEKLRRQGFVRIRLDGQIVELDESLKPARGEQHEVEIVVDRLVIREGVRQRLMESIEAALRWNEREVRFLIGDAEQPNLVSFTTAFSNPRTGYVFEKLTPQHFSFNTHLGACPVCEGVGTLPAPDPALMVPDPEQSLNAGAVRTWWSRNPKLKAVQQRAIESLANHYGVALDAPFRNLPQAFKDALFHGAEDKGAGLKKPATKPSSVKLSLFEGLIKEAERLYLNAESEGLRAQVSRFMNPKPCPACGGKRLRREALAVLLQSDSSAELSIHEFTTLPVREALVWLRNLVLTEYQRSYTEELRNEILKRIEFLDEVGLGYLALNRESGTLSGGEMQRIRLATQIGAGLAGVLYVLDEPSIGLHPVDNEKLIATLLRLRDLGNTVLVVEHDEPTMRAADYIIELGRGAGPHGGEITAQGTPAALEANEHSLTGAYLSKRLRIPVPKTRMAPRPEPASDRARPTHLIVHHATAHNLRHVTAAFPLGCMTCVTGPSGSGKSTLVDDILMRALQRHFYRSKDEPAEHERITGIEGIDKVVIIDQAPIGRSPRSNPATYTGAFGPIRDLFAQLPLARVRGYDSGRFSFNVSGGRCEKCQGDGQLKIDMHFLADVYVTCDQCQGRRYNAETLEVTFKGRNISEVLEMTVSEALRFFGKASAIAEKLRTLEECGLGYIRLGQAGNSLSGGEAQRVKLSAELARKATGSTLYVLDEPTTGLHFADIQMLLAVLLRLRDAGNTLIVIEHNIDVIKSADWVIDLGPGGGSEGGEIVATGTPEEVAHAERSATARFLRECL